MSVSRRGLFGLFAGALATPYVGKLPSIAVAGPMSGAELSLADIVAVTLRNRSATIVNNLSRPNPLLNIALAQRGVNP